jgi:pimeloyl-ACP methyl ester carboxylesterase
MNQQTREASNYITPFVINGLHGRVLKIPATKIGATKHNILMLYGHHSSLERMFGIVKDVAQYGNITMPDLPGFGGMDSFYKISEKPTLDNLADYLATFIKMNYKKQKISVSGMSFGFVIITRMLQLHPEIAKQIDLIISIVGFSHKSDFKFKKKTYFAFRWLSSISSTYLISAFAKHVVLRGPIIRLAYNSVADKHVKMKDADDDERKKRINFEIHLWKCNDIRTYMDTTITMLTLDLTDIKIDKDVMHVAVDVDQYFDNKRVKKHLKLIFNKVDMHKAIVSNHAPTVIAAEETARAFIPQSIRRQIVKLSGS